MDIKGIRAHGTYGPELLESLSAYVVVVDLEFDGGALTSPLVFSSEELQKLGDLKGLEALELFAEKLKKCFLGLRHLIKDRDANDI